MLPIQTIRRFLAFLSVLLAVSVPATAGFSHNYGGVKGADVRATAVAVDALGNSYVTGSFTSTTVTLGGVTLARLGGQDAFVVKLDLNGNVLWARNFGGAAANVGADGRSIAVDGVGNVYVAGNFSGGNLATPALTRMGFQTVFAIKLSSTGTTTWAQNFGGAGALTDSQSIAVDGAGNVYVGGSFQFANLTTPAALTKIGSRDAFAIKLSSTGTTTWAQNFGGAGAQMSAQSIAVDGAGNVYLGGSFSSASLTTPALAKIGSFDAFAIKLSSTGTTTWSRNFGGFNAGAFVQSIAVDGAGDVYLGGRFHTNSLTTPALAKIGFIDAFAIKLSSTGTTTWARNFGGAGVDAEGRSIAVDGAGNVYLGGYFGTADLTTPALAKIGIGDAFAIKLSPAGTTTWAQNFGGANAGAIGQSIAVDGSGNVYLAGEFHDASLTTPALTKIGNNDAFAIKLDPTGTPAWSRNYGGGLQGFTSINSVTADASGNSYVTGSFDDDTVTLGGVTLTRLGTQDAFVAKLDPNGNVLWARNFGGAGAQAEGRSIAVDAAGNVYLGGYFANASLTTPALTVIGILDVLAIKLDPAGTTTWAQGFGGTNAVAIAQAIAVDGAGNVYLGGSFNNASLTTPALTQIGSQDAFAIKLSPAGTPTWAQGFGGAGANTFGNSIAADGAGNVYVGGYFHAASLTTPALTQIGTYDAFAIKLSPAGTTTWAQNFGGAGAWTYGNSIAVDGTGNVYLGGNFTGGSLTTPALPQVGFQDAFAIKLSSTGTPTWARNFGSTAGAQTNGQSIAVDGAGNVYLGGYFQFADLTTPALVKIGSQDAFALRLSPTGATLWSGNFGGTGATAFGQSVAVDGSGRLYLAGYFTDASLTTPALAKIGNYDAFILQLTPATAPDAPSGIGAIAGNAQATVSFTAPAFDGGSPILDYTVSCSPGPVNATGAGSPIVVTGLTNGTTYSCSVTARNIAGTSASSAAVLVTPVLPTFTVTPSAGANGTITPGTPQAVGQGSSVTFTVTAAAGYSAAVGGTCGGTLTGTTYTTSAITGDCTVVASFTPTDLARLGAISTRMQVLTADNVLIAGFIIGGSTPKTVVINARGPSLTALGVPGALQNPTLQLVSGAAVIASNDDWGTAPYAAQLQSLGLNPPNPAESSILVTLAPGAYTAIVSGVGGQTGVGIAEVFEVDAPQSPLSAISTRGIVLRGSDIMIGGFIIRGSSPQTVVIRARGPSLAAQGVASPLPNPALQLFSGPAVIASNDDWGTAPNAAQVTAAGFAPADSRESAILVTLDPGAYTAQVSGVGGATGVGIVEVFAVP